MKTVGIVAEYNPFHSGHALHVRESRRLAEEETTIVAVMSGDYVQRGEPAIYDKFARAEAAVRGGVDLVAELPIWISLSSAEGFAAGALKILKELHAEILSFGSETGNLEPLLEIAYLFRQQDFLESVRQELREKPEQSFAKARQSVAERVLNRELPELKQPNNILAIEYLKACSGMTPFAVRRHGAGHDQKGESDYPSASQIRDILRAEGKGPDADLQELLFLDRLRQCSRNHFPDDGLGERMYREIRNQNSYEEYIRACATRRFPLARVRRTALRAILNIQDAEPAYIRILAFNEKGQALLRKQKILPLLIKPAHVRKMGEEALKQFEMTSQAHDLYQLMNHHTASGEDWRRGPAKV